jgi:preprotein translocase subunit Sec63
MGKGGANPYPMWWASSDEPVVRNRTEPSEDHYKSKQDKEREYYDKYYSEKSYSKRREEFEEEFKRNFFSGKYFSAQRREENHNIDPIFKIKKSSSEEDFKKAYRKLVLEHHPDKGGDSKVFIKIQEAWEKLKVHFAS